MNTTEPTKQDERVDQEYDAKEISASEEKKALAKIVNSIRCYYDYNMVDVDRWKHNFAKLSAEHQALLWDQPEKYQRAQECIKRNAYFFNMMLDEFSHQDAPPHLQVGVWGGEGALEACSSGDAEKVRYVLKNLVRDWSEEGKPERDQSHAPLLEELQKWVKVKEGEDPPEVCIPGAGLGRLCVEVARLGYSAQGNEYSYYMLLTSSFILNNTISSEELKIYPWVHASCNQVSDSAQLRSVLVPDILPSGQPIRPGCLSMCAGDFVEVYSAPEQTGSWDAVLTCFFIDTAHNIVQYLEIISNMLKEGGAWINIGPLLYHWADAHTYMSGEELSVEVSLEVVERLARGMGLRMERTERRHCLYTANPTSMMQTLYNCVFWTMIKDSSLKTSSKGGAADKSTADNTHSKKRERDTPEDMQRDDESRQRGS